MNTDKPPPTREFTALRELDTDRLAQALAERCADGTVIGLIGTLGAGKTRFVQGLASALGVARSAVTSPTFVLCHEYHGRLHLYHYDAYRLRSLDEWLRLGVEEQVGEDGISVIEWSDRIADLLPVDRLDIEIEIRGETSRRFLLRAGGDDSARLLAAVDSLDRRVADGG